MYDRLHTTDGSHTHTRVALVSGEMARQGRRSCTSATKIVQGMSAELHIEEAMLNAQQTLTLVLCNKTICFRPLHITAQEVDVAAALTGQPRAQHALQEWRHSALRGVI